METINAITCLVCVFFLGMITGVFFADEIADWAIRKVDEIRERVERYRERYKGGE